MKIWKSLFSKVQKKKKEEYVLAVAEEYSEEDVLCRDDVNLYNGEERARYVRSCLEQMKDAEREIEQLTREYETVTSYLTDIEELEDLPSGEKFDLSQIADRVAVYEREKDSYRAGSSRMPEVLFRQVERMENETEESIRKLTEAEAYQDKIRQDMRRLDGERHAFQCRKHDLQNSLGNMRGMIIITSFAFVTCMTILFLLQVLMQMDISIGYILTAAVTVFTAFYIYMKYTDAVKEKRQVEKAINKLILLQNKVKIRYVNNTNLLDYLYAKYNVGSSEDLIRMWEVYQKEKEEREKVRELDMELDALRRELLTILRRYQIRDPEMWLDQVSAIANEKEMVELRHQLILRRQKLRKQMEYNEKLGENAKGEIKSLVEEFPAFAPEIMEQISDFEKSSC